MQAHQPSAARTARSALPRQVDVVVVVGVVVPAEVAEKPLGRPARRASGFAAPSIESPPSHQVCLNSMFLSSCRSCLWALASRERLPG